MDKKRILIVDDEPNIRRILQVAFEKLGHQAICAEDALQAIKYLKDQDFALVITDVTMPGQSGYELLKEIKSRWAKTPVVIMTAFGTIPQAIQAIRDGAYEYVTKPFDLDVLKRIAASAMLEESPKSKRLRSKAQGSASPFLAESSAMKEVLGTVQQVADSRATVMVTGESGVGKEVVARALHTFSSRAPKAFVAVSCAALPETLLESELFGYEKGAFTGAQGAKPGRFEMADAGTLFLDEIGEIPASVQVKLLRVLQEREFDRLGANKPTRVDLRVVTATNRDLREAVEQGVFRLDLLYRLQVVEIEIPPLRARLEDVVPLAQMFLAKFADENGRGPLAIGPAAEAALFAYGWPGNVRELENTMERAIVLAAPSQNELTVDLLPTAIRKAAA